MNMDCYDILNLKPFEVEQSEKEAIYLPYMRELTEMHRQNCEPYRRILKVLSPKEPENVSEIPMLPVSLFKELELKSIGEDHIFKRMTSSGTTGQRPSLILLDKKTSAMQQRALSLIVSDFIGGKRLPMLIIDSPDVLKDRTRFSARGAGIMGFSIFGRDRIYALDENMNPNYDAIESFFDQHKDEPVLMFGFTYMVWNCFIQKLQRDGRKLPANNGILIHGGGWKKLQKQAVSPKIFKENIKKYAGISRICNYYGMVEQTGSIYMECESGHLHASSYSDIFVRRMKDFSLCDIGEEGVIQVMSPIAMSYPGHSLLTEDKGRILGIDDCPCGRKGKYFEVTGRIPFAEVRGCSDTFEYKREKNESFESAEFPKEDKKDSMEEKVTVLCPFDDRVMDFLDELSRRMRKNMSLRSHQDIYSFAFWCRRSNLEKMKKRYEATAHHQYRLGRGCVFHIAPANIPSMFAYTAVIGLLAGNTNVVKVSSRVREESEILLNILDEVLEDSRFKFLKSMLQFVTYDSSDRLQTEKYSSNCDVRVIWGGDRTIQNIRTIPLAGNASEIAFGDRYSVGYLREDSIERMTEEELQKLAHRFWMDTYSMDQNACSSPYMMFWQQSNNSNTDYNKGIRKKFWDAVAREAKRQGLADIHISKKYGDLCQYAAKYPEILGGYLVENILYVMQLENYSLNAEQIVELRGKFGLFFEMTVKNQEDIVPYLTRKVQTITCETDNRDNLKKMVYENACRGVDRIVSFGEALNMDIIWDGMNLIDTMSRVID